MSKAEKKIKKSIFAEFSLLSAGSLILILGLIAFCVAFYIYMAKPPEKKVMLTDDAGVFTQEEKESLLKTAEHLSSDEDINVLIVTTRSKGSGYTDSDEDCARFAEDFYKKNAMSKYFKDNSGICILLDLTLDYPGGRFFWLYTYGTAHYSMPDSVINQMFKDQRKTLSDGQYSTALTTILTQIDDGKIRSIGVWSLYLILIAAPLLLAGITVFRALKPAKLDPAPDSSAYMMNVKDAGGETRKTSSHTTEIAWLEWIGKVLWFILTCLAEAATSGGSSSGGGSSRSSSSRSSSSGGSSRSSGGRSGGGGGRF